MHASANLLRGTELGAPLLLFALKLLLLAAAIGVLAAQRVVRVARVAHIGGVGHELLVLEVGVAGGGSGRGSRRSLLLEDAQQVVDLNLINCASTRRSLGSVRAAG